MAACLAPEERDADVPPSAAAFAAPRALQTLGCCEMLSPTSLLGHGALQVPGGRGRGCLSLQLLVTPGCSVHGQGW